MVDPLRLNLLTGKWELRWTDEKAVNIAVANGLFGLPWICTNQTIDVPGGWLCGNSQGRVHTKSTLTESSTDTEHESSCMCYDS